MWPVFKIFFIIYYLPTWCKVATDYTKLPIQTSEKSTYYLFLEEILIFIPF